jgi:hypothetical protein
LLKGEALHVFNDKAVEQKEETMDSHIQCLWAITEHLFPKDNPLHKQKTFMCNHMFLHLSDRMISEFHARWIKLNNYLDEWQDLHDDDKTCMQSSYWELILENGQ